MFDPFKDFDARGYLRNVVGEKNLNIVKQLEHDLFTANLADAMAYLSRKKSSLITISSRYTQFCLATFTLGPVATG
ncbi:hypothetical protein VRB50_19510 [Pseudomonas poae]|uniref:hypothetical protein n=1 Tax=Pseudomonas poae TaxID=200451 RepID=UPI0021CCDD2F|nr:hypothetical protein [Pseudomonas poae]